MEQAQDEGAGAVDVGTADLGGDEACGREESGSARREREDDLVEKEQDVERRARRTLLDRIRREQLVRRPPRHLLGPPRRPPLLDRVETELVVVLVLRLLVHLVVVPQAEHLFERQALPDEVQDGLDVLDREDAAPDLALEAGRRRADEPGAVAQAQVGVPEDGLRAYMSESQLLMVMQRRERERDGPGASWSCPACATL